MSRIFIAGTLFLLTGCASTPAPPPTVQTGPNAEVTTYTRSYGLVSLIVELRDSESGEILLRAGDRRDPTGTRR